MALFKENPFAAACVGRRVRLFRVATAPKIIFADGLSADLVALWNHDGEHIIAVERPEFPVLEMGSVIPEAKGATNAD